MNVIQITNVITDALILHLKIHHIVYKCSDKIFLKQKIFQIVTLMVFFASILYHMEINHWYNKWKV